MSETVESTEAAKNNLKVKKMLLDIPGLGVKTLREDVFLVSEPETDIEFIVDVEESTLFLRAEIGDVSKKGSEALYRYLLELNASAVHVAFGLDDNKLILKGDLEIDNLDENELEASCKSLVVTLYQASDELAKYLD